MFTIQKYRNKRILVKYEDELTTKLKNKFSKAFKPFTSRWSSQNNGWLLPNQYKEDIEQVITELSSGSSALAEPTHGVREFHRQKSLKNNLL